MKNRLLLGILLIGSSLSADGEKIAQEDLSFFAGFTSAIGTVLLHSQDAPIYQQIVCIGLGASFCYFLEKTKK